MPALDPARKAALVCLLQTLVDQQAARVLVSPNRPASGFWFGGGNLAQDRDGTIWLVGRYRDVGDSRTGLEAGARGLECAVFRSDDGGHTFRKAASWSKADLSRPERTVLSIEGTSLHARTDGTWELFVSSEKRLPYPDGLDDYQKPGTGVWTIDRMTGPSPDQLDTDTLDSVLENNVRPDHLHVKDPVVFDAPNGATRMIFCTHPFTWASGNSALAERPEDTPEFTVQTWELASRGAAWDVASTRITAKLPVPRVGCFADAPPCSIYLYDGCECVRQLDESNKAKRRPRGYSCEELSGAMFGWDEHVRNLERLSLLQPMFVSPWGTGCSRYTKCLVTDAGIFAAWQQSQPDKSQPLVGHLLPMDRVHDILA